MNDPVKKNDLVEGILKLRKKYIESLPEKITAIDYVWDKILNEPMYESYLKELQRQTHSLAGSGSTFGCQSITDIARDLNKLCKNILQSKSALSQSNINEVERYKRKLNKSAQHYADIIASDNTSVSGSDDILPGPSEEIALIYILDDELNYAQHLGAALSSNGYDVKCAPTLDQLKMLIEQQTPSVIILDIMFDDDENAGFKAVSELESIPVVFISQRDDMDARLNAVRAGAIDYFNKPVDISGLLTTLDQTTEKKEAMAYRIFMIDDDLDLLNFYRHVLSQKGMVVDAHNDCGNAVEKIRGFKPDLIVLDVEMPKINGIEMGALIRQFDEFRHIPIVFLTLNSNVQSRIASLHLGADDYIVKPVGVEFLVESLRARAQRARDMYRGTLDLETAMHDLEFMKSALNQHAIVSGTDADGKITYVNENFVEFTKYPEEKLIGETHNILKSGLHDDVFYKEMWHTISHGGVWQGTIHNRDTNGNIIDTFTTIVPQMDEAGIAKRYMAIRTDITDLNQMQIRLQEDAERLSMALEATRSGMWEWNIEGGTVLYSDSWLNVMGYSIEDVADISWPDLIHEEEFKETFNKMMKVISGESELFQSNHRLRNHNGDYDWVNEIGKVVMRDEHGQALRIVGMTRVINERVKLEAQKEAMQRQLVQSSKIESIGQLTAGIAHDFNNLLGGILGYAELSREVVRKDDAPPKLEKFLGEIITAGNRAKELIGQMLIFSRLSPENEEKEIPVVIIQPVVKEAIKLLDASIPKTIEIDVCFENKDLKVAVQPVQLHQIIVNLCVNAKDAMRNEYGKITVNVSSVTSQGICDSCHESFDSNFVKISVSDDGEGMSDELKDKVFDPFYTTKDVGKGTGMGLSIVHGVMHSLGGHLMLESEAGKGTTISLLLPEVTDDSDVENIICDHDEELQKNLMKDVRVLIVDDEHAMCSMLTELLRFNGAIVSSYTVSPDALHAFEENPDNFDLVITDEKMPVLRGFDLARNILDRRPDIPVILCSGFSETVNETSALDAGIRAFFDKPIDIKKLLTTAQHFAAQQKE